MRLRQACKVHNKVCSHYAAFVQIQSYLLCPLSTINDAMTQSKPSMPSKYQSKAKTVPRRKLASTSEPSPLWPSLHPLLPTSDLSLETILSEQIIVIRNLFTSKLCKDYVSFLSSLPLTTTPEVPKRGNAIRVNDRVQFDDPDFAEQLWSSTGLKDLVTGAAQNEAGSITDPEELQKLWGGDICGLNPRIRVYRYGKGQYFGQHCE